MRRNKNMPERWATYERTTFGGVSKNPAWEVEIHDDDGPIERQTISYDVDLRPVLQLLLGLGLWVRQKEQGEVLKPLDRYDWEKPS